MRLLMGLYGPRMTLTARNVEGARGGGRAEARGVFGEGGAGVGGPSALAALTCSPSMASG